MNPRVCSLGISPRCRKVDSWAGTNPECPKCRYEKTKSAYRERNAKSKAKHPEYWKSWREKNRSKLNEYNNAYSKTRKAADPAYKIKHNLRIRMNRCLKGELKAHHMLSITGKTADGLKLHLESTWKPGMSWENYGSHWHIDHIVPCAAFDLSNPDEQARCFHFSNLQALSAVDNMSKGDRLT
jgi:hypothetical protein